MKKVWITGVGGLIGNELARHSLSTDHGFQIVPLDRQALELTDFDAVRGRFKKDSPDVLLHCAAMSNSQFCESEPWLARHINVDLTALLVELFAGGKVVFFSTDLVFDGARGEYLETDTPNPLGVYAQTKAAAERIVLVHPQNVVIRTSINGGHSPKGNRGFNEVLKNFWKAGRATRLFQDEFRCPIPASVTASATWELLRQDERGIYHVAGGSRLSRLEIGQLIASRHPELNPQIQVASIADFKGPPRAPDVSLDCSKARSILSFNLPGLAGWLEANPKDSF